MSLSVEYVPTRQEVRDAYRWSFRQPRGLWRYHLAIVVGFAAIYVITETNAGTLEGSDYLLGAFYGLLASLWVSFIPQIMYSEERRTLAFGTKGVEVKRGSAEKRIPWHKVMRICMARGQIYILTKSGSALVIPARIFETETMRDEFLASLTGLHGASGTR